MDPTKKGKIENAQGVLALEYEPTMVSTLVLTINYNLNSVNLKSCCCVCGGGV